MSQTFEPLFDPAAAGREGVSAEELAERLFGELSEETATPSGRPYLLLNMIASVDGRITSEGRSGPLGGPADRELFHALRTVADGVLVGARTVRVERYNRIVAEERHRRLRAARGLDEEPYACVLTASGSFDRRIPLFAERGVRLIALTTEGVSVAAAGEVEHIRAGHGEVDLIAALAELRSRYGVRVVVCEGGAHTAGALVAADLVDELLLTVSPQLTGGDIASTPAGSRGIEAGEREAAEAALALLSGPPLQPPRHLKLRWVYRSGSFLFLRYRLAPV